MHTKRLKLFLGKYPRLKKLTNILLKFADDDIFGLSAELTFYLITSFFPFAILLLSLFYITPLSAEETLFTLFSALPKDVYDTVINLLTGINISLPIVIFSSIIALWSMSGAISTINKALNRMYKTEESRNKLIIRSIGMVFSFLLAITIVLAFSMLILGNVIGNILQRFFPNFNLIWDLLRIIFMFFIIFCVFASIYKILPNKKLKFKSIFTGAFFTTVFWSFGSLLFSFYVDNFSMHHIIYGSLAGIVVLVTWLYMTSFIILTGGQINSIIFKSELA